MRKINGYVFITKTQNITPVFGKSVFNKRFYENFETNDFTTFDSPSEAEKAGKDFELREKGTRTRVYRVKMILSEKQDEFDFFNDKTNLALVHKIDEDFKRLVGPWTRESIPVTADNIGSYLINNGFKLFNEESSKKGDVFNLREKTPYEQALYVLRDIKRQTQTGGLLAKIDLENIHNLI